MRRLAVHRPTLKDVFHSATKPAGLIAVSALTLDIIALLLIAGFGPVFLVIAIAAAVCFVIGCCME